LIATDIVNIKKIFIDFRIRTLSIDIISEFSTNIRTIRKDIKIIKNVINSRKEEVVPPNIIKEIPIWMKKKLDNNRDFLFLSEYPNAIYHIMDSKFSFIQIRNDGEDPMRIFKGRLKLIKKFIKIEYHHVDPESHNFAILRNINSEFHLRSLTTEKHNILIIYIINVYRDARPQDLDHIIYLRTFAAKSAPMRTALIRNSQIKKQR
jgi:hypothetical protein